QALAAQERAAPAFGGPLLAGTEVVDIAEVDVVHRRPVCDRHGQREEGDPALGIQGAVDRVDDYVRRTARAEVALAELLRNQREVAARRLEPPDDRGLGGSVDRNGVVASFACADDRL